jgi:enamine deaminase RidA (YjgF/YER057c/UK114 family)
MRAEINIYNPVDLGPPMGQYTHVTRVKASEFLFIAGMLSGDAKGEIVGDGDFDAQATQVFANINAALRSAGCKVVKRRSVHHLSGALTRHPKIHGISAARISENVC